jgi:hypothetical protein
MTGLPGVNFPPSIIDTTGTAARCKVDDRGTMTGLPGVSFPASIVGTTGTEGRPRRLPGR